MDLQVLGFALVALVLAAVIALFAVIILSAGRRSSEPAPAPHDPGVHRILVLLTTDCVDERVCRRIAAERGPVAVRVVVPPLSGRLAYYVASDDRAALLVAGARLERALGILAAHGIPGSGAIGDASASAAQLVADELGGFGPDEVVLVVHPAAEEQWSEQHLVHDAAQRFDVPVTVVHAFEPDAAPAAAA
jgi:hypothetical protein